MTTTIERRRLAWRKPFVSKVQPEAVANLTLVAEDGREVKITMEIWPEPKRASDGRTRIAKRHANVDRVIGIAVAYKSGAMLEVFHGDQTRLEY